MNSVPTIVAHLTIQRVCKEPQESSAPSLVCNLKVRKYLKGHYQKVPTEYSTLYFYVL